MCDPMLLFLIEKLTFFLVISCLLYKPIEAKGFCKPAILTNNQAPSPVLMPFFKKDCAKKPNPPKQDLIKVSSSLLFQKEKPSEAEKYRKYIKDILEKSKFLSHIDLENEQFKENEIVFCHTLALHGAKAVASQEIINGINAHFNAVNEAGGIADKILRLISVNDSANPILTKEAVNNLIFKKNLRLFFGNSGESNLFSIFPQIKDGELLMLFPHAYSKSLLSPYLKYLINGTNNRELQLDKIIEFVVHSLQVKEAIGIFYPDDEFGRYQAKYLDSRLKELKLTKQTLVSYNPNNPTIISEAEKLTKDHPKAIITLGSYMINARLISQVMSKGELQTIFVGTEEIYFASKILEDIIERSKLGSNFKIYCVTFVPSVADTGYQFVRDYIKDVHNLAKKRGEDRISLSPLGLSYYLNAKVVTKALQKIYQTHPELKDCNVHSKDFLTKLIICIQNFKSEDIGDFYVDFDYLNRCAYPAQPNILSL